MPGPTTEVLSDDLKELKAEVHAITVGVAEIRTELRLVVGIARWAGALLVTTILGSGIAGVWWAATLNARVGAVESRLDRLEGGIAKAIGQAAKDATPPR